MTRFQCHVSSRERNSRPLKRTENEQIFIDRTSNTWALILYRLTISTKWAEWICNTIWIEEINIYYFHSEWVHYISHLFFVFVAGITWILLYVIARIDTICIQYLTALLGNIRPKPINVRKKLMLLELYLQCTPPLWSKAWCNITQRIKRLSIDAAVRS